MKKNKWNNHRFLNIVASLALVISAVTANSTCWFVMYHEKMPDKLKKLRYEKNKLNNCCCID